VIADTGIQVLTMALLQEPLTDPARVQSRIELTYHALGEAFENLLDSLELLDFIGVAWAYALTAVLYALSLAILLTMPSLPRTGEPAAGTPLSVQIRQGLTFLRNSASLRSVLGVTILVNVFMFSFQPLVPVFAERLDVGDGLGRELLVAREPGAAFARAGARSLVLACGGHGPRSVPAAPPNPRPRTTRPAGPAQEASTSRR